MTTRAEVVAEARTWLGTPFHHQARLKSVGVDCVGLVIGVAHALGLSDFDTSDYGEQPDPAAMGSALREHLDEIAVDDLLPGDILWLRMRVDPQHVAIVTETAPRTMMIHALRRRMDRRARGFNKVFEHSLDGVWRKRIVGCFRYRGVA